MNRIYRLIWSRRLRGYVAACEHARGCGKSGASGGAGKALRVGALLAAVSLAGGAHAGGSVGLGGNTLPTGGRVTAGSAQISESGNTLTVHEGSGAAAIDWQSFSVGSHATVDFVQPGASAVVLNRVVGSETSVIDGALNANGQVFLLNANGVLIGRGASIDAQGFVASTLSLSDADLLAGKRSFSGSSSASILNLGTINAKQGGYVALLGQQAVNEGLIQARLGTVALAAGDKISLNFNGNSLLGVAVDKGTLHGLVANRQAIVADGGTVILTAKGLDAVLAASVNNTGLIQAQTIGESQGHIYLLGDQQSASVSVGGTLDASAPNGGNGGSIETSAANVHVANGTKITTSAAQGITGSWLVDPQDFTVAASGGDITGTTLTSELAGTNVTLQSSSGATAGSGNINVNDAVSWSGHLLTLTAANNINVNAVMTITGTGSLTLNPATSNGADSAVSGGTVNFGLGPTGFFGRADFSGTGTLTISGNVYTIINSLGSGPNDTTAGTLQGMQGNLSGYYALGSNIDATATGQGGAWGSTGFVPVGKGCYGCTGFSGTFNGLGHTINGLTINVGPSTAVNGFVGDSGMFGYGMTSSAMSNVGLTNVSLNVNAGGNATASIGALVGRMNGPISNCYATGTVTASSTINNLYEEGQVGGLVGYLFGDSTPGAITGSWANVNVSAPDFVYVGGLVGNFLSLQSITNSYATGNVVGEEQVGGLVGGVSGGSVSNSYATGNVTGSTYVGGLIGELGGSLSNSFATGTVTASGAWSGNREVGGLVGYASYSSIENSYASGNVIVSGAVTGNTYAGGLVGFNYGPSTLKTSYYSGTLTNTATSGGTTNVGALIGFNYAGYYGGKMVSTASFFNSTNNGGLVAVGGAGASQAGTAGLTTAQMMSASSFQPQGTASGQWDFTNVWFLYQGDTNPLLRSFLTPLTIAAGNVTIANGAPVPAGLSNATYTLIGGDGNLYGLNNPYAGASAAGTYAPNVWSDQLGYLITFAGGNLTVSPPASSGSSGGSSGGGTSGGGTGGSTSGPTFNNALESDAVASALLTSTPDGPSTGDDSASSAPAHPLSVGSLATLMGGGDSPFAGLPADTPLTFASAPDAGGPTQLVNLSQAQQIQSSPGSSGQGSTDNQSHDVRVPVSRNSLAEIVNGGVKLPSGVEQQLFVVKSN
jgi:filamentous hemagglutinin family protein